MGGRGKPIYHPPIEGKIGKKQGGGGGSLRGTICNSIKVKIMKGKKSGNKKT